MGETVALILQLVTALGVLYGILLTARKQPSEIKAALAGAGTAEAVAGGQYIDNQNKLLTMFSEESLAKVDLLNKFGALQVRVIDLETQNAQLNVGFGAVTKRAEAAETRALGCEMEVVGYKARYEALELKNIDYQKRLELAEAEIISLKAAAEVNTTTNAANAAASLVRANTAALAAGATPAVASELPSLPTVSDKPATPPEVPPTS